MLGIQSKEKKNLLVNIISLLVLQGSNYLIPLLSIPYLFATLDIEKFGLVNFSFAFVQYFIILTDFGYNLSATKSIALHRDDVQKTQEIFNGVMGSKLFLFLIGLVILTCIVFFIPGFSSYKLIYFITYGMVLGSILFPVWFFQGMEKMKLITFLTISLKLLAIVPIFFLVKSSEDYLYVPLFNSLAWIACGVVSLYLIHKNFGIVPGQFTIHQVKQSLKESRPFFLSRVSVSLYTTSNLFSIGLISGNAAAGLYSAAEKLFQALQNAYFPINSSLYPFMTKTKDILLYKKVFLLAVVFNVVLISVLLFFSSEIIALFYLQENSEVVFVFQLLLIACFFIVPSVMLGYPLLAALGHSSFANKTVIGPSVIHLIALCVLIATKSFSIYTVAAMVIFTESLVLISRLYGVYKFKLYKL